MTISFEVWETDEAEPAKVHDQELALLVKIQTRFDHGPASVLVVEQIVRICLHFAYELHFNTFLGKERLANDVLIIVLHFHFPMRRNGQDERGNLYRMRIAYSSCTVGNVSKKQQTGLFDSAFRRADLIGAFGFDLAEDAHEWAVSEGFVVSICCPCDGKLHCGGFRTLQISVTDVWRASIENIA